MNVKSSLSNLEGKNLKVAIELEGMSRRFEDENAKVRQRLNGLNTRFTKLEREHAKAHQKSDELLSIARGKVAG